jgi:transcription antitermination factor NusG
MTDWLIARVMTNSEGQVAQRLSYLGYDSFFPQYRERVVDRRTLRRRWEARKLFPCYVFVRSLPRFYFLRAVRGVGGIVMKGPRPATSPQLDDKIEQFIANEDDSGFVDLPEVAELAKMSVGDRVMVLRGLFHGVAGAVEEIRGGRVKVLLGNVSVWHSELDLANAQA